MGIFNTGCLAAAIIQIMVFCGPVASAQDFDDPIEPVNRGIFWFNNQLDEYVLEPVAKGYDWVTPKPIQRGIDNFFTNLSFPLYLVSDILQGKMTQAAEHTGRFLINTTVGLAGFMDVAKDCGLENNREDLGLAMAYDGVPSGPYLMLPILGPSSLRDAVGRGAGMFLDPTFYLGSVGASSEAQWQIPLGMKTVQVVNDRASMLENIKTAKEASVDYYLFVRSAYYQHRRGLLYDGNPPEEEDEQ